MRQVALALILAGTATVSAFPQRGEAQTPPRIFHTCLLVDVHDEGLSLTPAAEGVVFDIDGDGVTERVAWPKPGSRLGFLALDVNGNGSIDSGAELVGSSLKHPSVTKRSSGMTTILLLQGATYDGAGNVSPPAAIGKSPALEPDDAIFQKLVIWRDNGPKRTIDASRVLQPASEPNLGGVTWCNSRQPTSARCDASIRRSRQHAFPAATNGTGEMGRKMFEVALDKIDR
jgi:hypothetical protein